MTNNRKITTAVCVAPWDHSRLLATFSHLAVPNHDQDGCAVLSSYGDSSANHGRHSTDHRSSSAKTQTPRYLPARYHMSNVDCRRLTQE